MYNIYKRHGYLNNDKIRLGEFREEYDSASKENIQVISAKN